MATEPDIRDALRQVLDPEIGVWLMCSGAGGGWGGLLNAVALLLFMVNTGRSTVLGGMRGESS
jgi:hypothetical protein